MVEADPFRSLPVTCSDGINQYQDPGLDDETRAAAISAVKHATGRSVFFLEDLMEKALLMAKHANNRPKDREVYERYADELLEEMLTRGR